MDQLPEDIIIEIFQYLDNDSMLNIMKSCSYFSRVFSTSSKLLLKLNLNISPGNVNQLSADESVSDVPFKNITISDVKIESDFDEIQNFLNKFANSVEILLLKNVKINNFERFEELFMDFENLRELNFEECTVADSVTGSLPLISSLKSMTFEECCQNIFKIFVHQKSVEKVTFYRNKISNSRNSFENLILMTTAMPNLNHMIINGFACSSFFDSENFPFKVQKFEATLLTGWWSVTEPRLNFLKSQQGSLKELKIHRLPYDDDGMEVLKFIIEEMKLEKFYLRNIPLILDGKKQKVRKLTVYEYEICSIYEMFRQFPIQFLTLSLSHTHIDEEAVHQIINPTTNLFENLQSLEIVDQSMELKNFPRFLGLYRNCRNIKKLSISTIDDEINLVLLECLPKMTQLNEIYLNVNMKDNLMNEMLKIVKNYALNLQKLCIVDKFVDEATNFFDKNVLIFELD